MRLKLYILALICFFEKAEVKKALLSLVKQFAFKKQSESKKTARLHTVLSRKLVDNLIIEEETSETGLGFVDKFVSLFVLRKKLDKVRNEISAKYWCSAYPHVWGNELYNRSVSISNPFFEKIVFTSYDKPHGRRQRKRKQIHSYVFESANQCVEDYDEY